MGKITVKHYLNKQLKPEIDESTNEKYYPIYYVVIVSSKTIKRRSHISTGITETDFNNNCDNLPDCKRQMEYEKGLITRIVKRYLKDVESNNEKKELFTFFDLKGYNSKDSFLNLLNAYIDFYSHSIYEAVWNYCTDKIETEVYKKLTSLFNLPDISITKEIFKYQSANIHEAILIHDNLNDEIMVYYAIRWKLQNFLSPYDLKTGYDIPLIDWLDNIMQDDLINYLKEERKFKIHVIQYNDGFFKEHATIDDFSTSLSSNKYLKKEVLTIDTDLINNIVGIIDGIIKNDDYIKTAKSRRIY